MSLSDLRSGKGQLHSISVATNRFPKFQGSPNHSLGSNAILVHMKASVMQLSCGFAQQPQLPRAIINP
jgi:hypothetical protein